MAACGGSDSDTVSEEPTRNLVVSYENAVDSFFNNAKLDEYEEITEIDPSDIQKTSASYSGYMVIQTVDVESGEDVGDNYNGNHYREFAIGALTMDASFQNGSAEIDGTAKNFEYIAVDTNSVFNMGEEISSDTEEESLADLDGSIDFNGTVSGTEGSLINVAGTLSGVVDDVTYDASVSGDVTGFFNETVDGDDMFLAGGTLEIDTQFDGIQQLENNTTIIALPD